MADHKHDPKKERKDDQTLTGEPLLAPEDSPTTIVENYQTSVGDAIHEIAESVPKVARREARRLYWLALLAAFIIPTLISLVALNVGLENRAQVAAQQTAQSRSMANLETIRGQIAAYNVTLKSEGKPEVPLPTDPATASSSLTVARLLLQFKKGAVIAGPPGPMGPAGPRGPQGERGPPGESSSSTTTVTPAPRTTTILPAPPPTTYVPRFVPMPGTVVIPR